MNFFKKFINYVNKDILFEAESKELTVLLRIQALIDMAYSLILAIVFLCAFGLLPAIIILFCIFFLCVFFNLSYSFNSKRLLSIYSIILFAETIFCCLYVSAGLGFRYIIFCVIPLIYFKSDESSSFRISNSVVACAISLILAIIGIFVPTYCTITRPIQILIICLATFIMTVKLIVISHFYYKKFASDESKIIKYSQKLEILATQDPLTKLQNRRGMETYLNKKINNNAYEEKMFCILMGDIDFFKKVNDTYGHEAGDYILTTVSSIMARFMQGKGRIARWGGEEFLLIFENLNGDMAYVEADNLRRTIEKTAFEYDRIPIRVTMTFGLEEYAPLSSLEDNIKKADDKLYLGKTSGRNTVIY